MAKSGTIQQQIETVRARIAELRRDRHDLARGSWPLPLAEAQARARAWLQGMADQGRRQLDVSAIVWPTGGLNGLRAALLPDGQLQRDEFEALAALVGFDLLARELDSAVGRALDGLPAGLTEDQQAARLAEIEAELPALERQDLELTAQANAAGLSVALREDTDARLLLGLSPPTTRTAP
jgi:hypothetical protein